MCVFFMFQSVFDESDVFHYTHYDCINECELLIHTAQR